MKCRVVFADNKIKDAFEKLKDSKTESQKLYVQLNRAFDDISECLLRYSNPKKIDPEKIS